MVDDIWWEKGYVVELYWKEGKEFVLGGEKGI